MIYKLCNREGKLVSVIKNEGLGIISLIPISEDNIDYQAYLKWLEEGNTPEPAEEQT